MAYEQIEIDDSTFIDRIYYDTSNNKMIVMMNTEFGYEYSNVPKNVANKFSNVSSVGSYWNQHIKTKYGEKRIFQPKR